MHDTYEAFGRGDIDAVMAVLDENILWNAPEALPHAMPVNGRNDVGAFFQNLVTTWEETGLHNSPTWRRMETESE